MPLPWLSVLMPIYNGSSYLAEALESVVEQGDKDVEIIAVDDGSEDGSIAILEDFARSIPITILRNGHEGNWVACTNKALARARSDHVCFLHQDDVWFPGRLSVVKRLLRVMPDAVLFIHASRFINKNGKDLGLIHCPLPTTKLMPSSRIVERLLVQDFIATPAPVFRRDAALAVGGLDESLWYSADWDFWLKLAGAGPAVYCSAPLCGFRIHRESQTISRSDAIEEIARQAKTVFERHFSCWAKRLPTSLELEPVARFANQLNEHLCAVFRGRRGHWLDVMRHFLALGLRGWHRFARDSRIAERVCARLRAGLFRNPQERASERRCGYDGDEGHDSRQHWGLRALGWLSRTNAHGRGREGHRRAGAIPSQV